jgi:hypothetical protein
MWCILKFLNDEGVINILSLIISIISVCVTVAISRYAKNLSNELIDKRKISDYKRKILFHIPLTNKPDSKEEVYAETIVQLKGYLDMGYYPYYQNAMNAASYGDSLLEFLILLENAKTDTYHPSNWNFIDIIKCIPANIVHNDYFDKNESKCSDITIGEYILEKDLEIIKEDDVYTIVTDKSHKGLRGYPRIEFRQLYRADFSSKNREEVLFLATEESGGTMAMTKIMGAYYGKKHWYDIRKTWILFDLGKVDKDRYFDPFK